jgi:two-component system response regulator HydG
VADVILIVDDERSNLESLERTFAREGWPVRTAASGAEALDVLRRERVAVLVTDLMMPGMDGEELLRAARAVSPETEVVLMTAYGTVEAAVSAMKLGAYDFITKPLKRHAVVKSVRQALERATLVAENRALRAQLAHLGGTAGLVGDAPSFRAAVDALRQAAPTSATVLLTGESGTGKELAARMLHDLSPRAAGPFVPIHCAAIPETMLESELFGYEKGAFTGAGARREGRFERAHGGTLFLDEVGEMSPAVQVKLLRVLQDGVVERLGGTQPIQVDVRLVAATNKDLAAEVKAGRFREDLFYRLDVVAVHLPPLRARRSDVPLLASAFLRRSPESTARRSPASRPRRCRRSRPTTGLATCGSWSMRWNAPWSVPRRGPRRRRLPRPSAARRDRSGRRARGHRHPVGTPMDEVERIVIRETLRQTRGDKTLAAQILGIAARTIYRKLERDESGRLVDPDDEA